MARHLVVRHVRARPGHQRFGAELGTGTQHHAGAANLAHARVGQADHRHLGNRRMVGEQALDLGRVAIEAAHDEHVLEAVGDAQVTALVEHTDIAGVQPALGVDGLARGGLVAQIALHHVVAAQQHLTRLARGHGHALRVDAAHFGARDGAAASAGHGLGAVAGVADRGDTAAFGQAVGGRDIGNAELLAHAGDQHRRHIGRAGHRDAQR